MLVVCLAWCGVARAPAQAPHAGPGPEEGTRRILEEVDQHSELMANLEYLCDMIGPRLTGSQALNRASEWTRGKFQGYGLANVTLEGWKIPRSWTRGVASGRVVSPVEQRLRLESAGWAPGTEGPTRGRVILLKAEKPADLDAYRGKVRGAWILCGSGRIPPERRGFLSEEGAAGIFRDSNKEHGLINMTGANYDYSRARIPEAFLTSESYRLLARLLGRGEVEVEIDVKNSFGDCEVEVFNTVAELVGVEMPDEVVIVGGHIDSWDLGTGATDNGTGIMAVIEAARALKASGVRPRRTIRFVLFAGEEQGLHGSKAYVEAHESEMDKISAVLVHDAGTGRVTNIGLQGRYDLREIMDRVVGPFQGRLNLDELSLRKMGGTDHLSFLPARVPAFAVVQHPAEYGKTHHTQSDTFDKVDPA